MIFETIIEKESKAEYEVKAHKSGENPQPCPVCSQDRRKKNQPCFSYNSQTGLGHCNHCGKSFYRKDENFKSYVRPVWENKTELPEKIVEWFLSRNINQDTLNQMKVTHSTQWMPHSQKEMNVICFNYFREGQLINTKYRSADKGFKLIKDAEKIFYNLDGIKDKTECYIVEGEIDCLTMVQAGFTNTVSVPNGATKGNNNLDYFDNCYRYFENMTKVYILTDYDEPGENLANELARRIGVEKCFRIALDGFKDVNEQLCRSGAVNVSNAKPYPLEGVFKVEDHWEGLLNILKNGFPKGWKPRGRLGELISFHPGYTSVVTGIPGHGKSEVIDQILIQMAIDYSIKGAFFTPENWPTEVHIIKLIEKSLGKSAFKSNELELKKAKTFLNEYFYWVYPEEGYQLETILEKVRQAVLKYGIKWFVLDPWNKLEHKRNGMSETDYISSSLDLISIFNKKNGTHCFIIAHPTKMKFNEKTGAYDVPGLYDINGSANWYNKADIGLSMYKKGDGQNTLYAQKVKFKFWGSVGSINLSWNKENGRYDEYGLDLTNWIDIKKQDKFIEFEQEINNDEVPF
jgi:twinkle protein